MPDKRDNRDLGFESSSSKSTSLARLGSFPASTTRVGLSKTSEESWMSSLDDEGS